MQRQAELPSWRRIALRGFTVFPLRTAHHGDIPFHLTHPVVNDNFIIVLDALGFLRRSHVALGTLLITTTCVWCSGSISLAILDVDIALHILFTCWLRHLHFDCLALPELPLMLLGDLLLNGVQGHEAPDVDLLLLARTPHAAHGLHLESDCLLLGMCLHRMYDQHVIGRRQVRPARRLLQRQQQHARPTFLVLELPQGSLSAPHTALQDYVRYREFGKGGADLALQILPLHEANHLGGRVVLLYLLCVLDQRLNLRSVLGKVGAFFLQVA
mmetsp:Transcript_20219/g.38049  ORF Transcript_20219/g.38049 Transcript_20219/m.38049 type:complete len:271 (-) Transcript_20219:165-977(-)